MEQLPTIRSQPCLLLPGIVARDSIVPVTTETVSTAKPCPSCLVYEAKRMTRTSLACLMSDVDRGDAGGHNVQLSPSRRCLTSSKGGGRLPTLPHPHPSSSNHTRNTRLGHVEAVLTGATLPLLMFDLFGGCVLTSFTCDSPLLLRCS